METTVRTAKQLVKVVESGAAVISGFKGLKDLKDAIEPRYHRGVHSPIVRLRTKVYWKSTCALDERC